MVLMKLWCSDSAKFWNSVSSSLSSWSAMSLQSVQMIDLGQKTFNPGSVGKISEQPHPWRPNMAATSNLPLKDLKSSVQLLDIVTIGVSPQEAIAYIHRVFDYHIQQCQGWIFSPNISDFRLLANCLTVCLFVRSPGEGCPCVIQETSTLVLWILLNNIQHSSHTLLVTIEWHAGISLFYIRQFLSVNICSQVLERSLNKRIKGT